MGSPGISVLRRIFSSGNAATDDYANRKVPRHRSWGYWGIMLPLTGGGTAGAWLAIGSSLASQYGMPNTIVGLVYAVIAQTVLGYVLVRASAGTRLSSDLASRGLGMGFLGSTVTAVVFGTNWFFYWALESQILGSGLAAFVHIPEQVGWVITGLLFIPLTLYGMVFVTRFQNWTIPVFVIWLVWNLVVIFQDPVSRERGRDFLTYTPNGGGLSVAGIFGVIATVNGVVALVPLLSMEFARFARPTDSPRRRFWGLLGVAVLPQNLLTWLIYLPVGVLVWRATGQTNPGTAFVALTGWVGFIGLFVTQIRINLQNTYASSLALSTLFARFLRFTPGRAFWSTVTCVVGTALIFVHMLDVINEVLTFEAVMLFAWIGTLFGDYAVVRGWLRMDVGEIEHRRAYLRRFNPIGLSSFATGACVGLALTYVPAATHLSGGVWTVLSSLASFLGFAVALVTHPFYARLYARRSATGGHGRYLARSPEEVPAEVRTAAGQVSCAACEVEVEVDDVARCPVRSFSWICSECCSADRTCRTACQSSTVTFPALPLRPSDAVGP
ncbi:purine-cytosine permease family protein [Amycolatopsis pigmentata]|uniref:Purine-cytosine permease family protein n=1 Tax=Amycolatopsis pigmentata TaxID=450801 RepID=A0ABW5G3Z7_9PSEU